MPGIGDDRGELVRGRAARAVGHRDGLPARRGVPLRECVPRSRPRGRRPPRRVPPEIVPPKKNDSPPLAGSGVLETCQPEAVWCSASGWTVPPLFSRCPNAHRSEPFAGDAEDLVVSLRERGRRLRLPRPARPVQDQRMAVPARPGAGADRPRPGGRRHDAVELVGEVGVRAGDACPRPALAAQGDRARTARPGEIADGPHAARPHGDAEELGAGAGARRRLDLPRRTAVCRPQDERPHVGAADGVEDVRTRQAADLVQDVLPAARVRGRDGRPGSRPHRRRRNGNRCQGGDDREGTAQPHGSLH